MPLSGSPEAFDPALHLTAADLRRIENEHGYGETQVDSRKEGSAEALKQKKTPFEVNMLSNLATRFTEESAAHPPYGLCMTTQPAQLVIVPAIVLLERKYLTEADTMEILRTQRLVVVHALSDLKLQLLLNEQFVNTLIENGNADILTAAAINAFQVTQGRTDSWKVVIQSAASNAKRSAYIILKQIIIQWLRTMDRLPTRKEFTDIARNSLPLLELLSSTHQVIFKVLNLRIIEDEQVGEFHRLLQKDGAVELGLEKRILDNMEIDDDQPKLRTMCPALLAKDAEGVSLIERSFAEDTKLVADMIFDGEQPRSDRFTEIAQEKLPKVSTHMYVKLREEEKSK